MEFEFLNDLLKIIVLPSVAAAIIVNIPGFQKVWEFIIEGLLDDEII